MANEGIVDGSQIKEGGSGSKNVECTWALHSSDQPGMVLVTSPLTRSNYLTWNIAMKISLEAKEKLGFVDHSLPAPPMADVVAYRRWKNADSMVKAWIINSISKDLADHFICFPSSQALWDELETRYGRRCGPQIYHIQRTITTIHQGDDLVSVYYGRLYKSWDELHRLMPRSVCTCGASKKNDEIDESLKLNQFLMGLNEAYDALRSQILALDPKPSVSKAFSMVAQMEAEREVKMTISSSVTDVGALLVRSSKIDVDQKGSKKKDSKKDRYCEHCNISGHAKDTCFKLHGYPDWYKEKKAGSSKKQQHNVVANVEVDNPLEQKDSADIATLISQLVRQELAKISKAKGGSDEHVSFVNVMDFADMKVLPNPINVHLPDGNSVKVNEVGTVILRPQD
ncbi:uncharacterized protein G2W53_028229 [Senna tora]|uniref:Retrotransposon Copia-like N-terminal domain-containing protein n=1 Tax=Senna tora TaxID=362788 RepID=A0A834T414_9FABA|nr:uncharacterized protein G2W53_028229 [Senna tora]